MCDTSNWHDVIVAQTNTVHILWFRLSSLRKRNEWWNPNNVEHEWKRDWARYRAYVEKEEICIVFDVCVVFTFKNHFSYVHIEMKTVGKRRRQFDRFLSFYTENARSLVSFLAPTLARAVCFVWLFVRDTKNHWINIGKGKNCKGKHKKRVFFHE